MLQGLVQIILWISVFMLAYVYVGYPLLVYLISLAFPRTISRSEIEPTVTILITAYNEAADIRDKLENTLKVEYPSDKLEILVASDGSTDETDEIVREFAPRITLFRQEGRVGKTVTQNNAVKAAKGDIILFSDATTEYAPDVLRKVLPAFSDDSVGCVAGRLVYVDKDETSIGSGAKRYWNYETMLKTAESSVCSLIGASGCLYAVRKAAYEPMYPEACSDFLICSVLYRKGLRSIFEPSAVCFEHTNKRVDDEMNMRIRVISQTFTDLWRNRDMTNPFRSGFFAVELISHKWLRYAVPLMLLMLFVTSGFMSFYSTLYFLAFCGQIAFYSMAGAGWLLEKAGKKVSLLAMPQYFILANLASVIAFYRFLRGESYAAWDPIRDAN